MNTKSLMTLSAIILALIGIIKYLYKIHHDMWLSFHSFNFPFVHIKWLTVWLLGERTIRVIKGMKRKLGRLI